MQDVFFRQIKHLNVFFFSVVIAEVQIVAPRAEGADDLKRECQFERFLGVLKRVDGDGA